MNYKFFNNCDEMLTYYFENGMDTCFDLVLEQIEKDECYLDDDWIQWCVVEFEEGDSVQPLALIGTRRVPCVMNSTHISSFEVNEKDGKQKEYKFIDYDVLLNGIDGESNGFQYLINELCNDDYKSEEFDN